MEIAGHRLFLPANIPFLKRLPSRFEILVTGKGAEKAGKIAFELEIGGQKIVLKSRIELKPGARYELEKISETQFKLIRQIEDPVGSFGAVSPTRPQGENAAPIGPYVPPDPQKWLPHELIAVKLFEEEGQAPLRRENKFYFDWMEEFALSGVFIPLPDGGYTLFLAGRAASDKALRTLSGILADLDIKNIRPASARALESIAAGAIDIKG